MLYTLTKPCDNCPFRTNVTPYLSPERVSEIATAVLQCQGTFTCHKTTVASSESEDGGMRDGPKAQHCAGALILLEKLERPNQMMRICERLGLYDRHKLVMGAPVFDSFEDMEDAQL